MVYGLRSVDLPSPRQQTQCTHSASFCFAISLLPLPQSPGNTSLTHQVLASEAQNDKDKTITSPLVCEDGLRTLDLVGSRRNVFTQREPTDLTCSQPSYMRVGGWSSASAELDHLACLEEGNGWSQVGTSLNFKLRYLSPSLFFRMYSNH